jgi:hypothetical protein
MSIARCRPLAVNKGVVNAAKTTASLQGGPGPIESPTRRAGRLGHLERGLHTNVVNAALHWRKLRFVGRPSACREQMLSVLRRESSGIRGTKEATEATA